MRPEREAPRLVADEVGMVIGNAEVVNGRQLGRRRDGLDRPELAIVAAEERVRLQR